MKAYTEEFKIKMVELYNAGKAPTEIVREYGMARSALSKWISKYNNTGSFKAKDNRSVQENELIQLRKNNKQLLMENEIIDIFNKNRKVYGTRKIKKVLESSASRKKISEIMGKYKLISKYT